MQEIKHFINGQFVSSESGRTFDDVNPANGEVIARVHEAGREEVDQAVAAANAAMNGPWGTMAVRLFILNASPRRLNRRMTTPWA